MEVFSSKLAVMLPVLDAYNAFSFFSYCLSSWKRENLARPTEGIWCPARGSGVKLTLVLCCPRSLLL